MPPNRPKSEETERQDKTTEGEGEGDGDVVDLPDKGAWEGRQGAHKADRGAVAHPVFVTLGTGTCLSHKSNLGWRLCRALRERHASKRRDIRFKFDRSHQSRKLGQQQPSQERFKGSKSVSTNELSCLLGLSCNKRERKK